MTTSIPATVPQVNHFRASVRSSSTCQCAPIMRSHLIRIKRIHLKDQNVRIIVIEIVKMRNRGDHKSSTDHKSRIPLYQTSLLEMSIIWI